MPKVPTRSAKPAKTSAKEESWSPHTPLCWRLNSNPSSPSLCEGPHREERWRTVPMAMVQRRIEGCDDSGKGRRHGWVATMDRGRLAQPATSMARRLLLLYFCRETEVAASKEESTGD
ncbi:hypothetical protein BHE74_00041110 [Ensete ventricosum]|nr:hypothetical protein GW17_00049878 [Ensete ventricosum]RWW52464.1 hypothetical protein BHE74_00041110 [Ensete ventricosum]RZR95942.1 hypothetical protein BHM03_00024853 [Ensete ventricosum]